MNILPELCMSSGRQRKLPAARVCRASRPPCPPTRARAGAGASSLLPRGVGLVCERDACTESPTPAGASRGVSGCAAPGTVSKPGGGHGERYWRSRNQQPAATTGASRAQHDAVSPCSWEQEQEQEQECWLVLKLEPSPQAAVAPQLLKPSSPSPERGCREVSNALHCGSDRRVGG